MSRVRLSRQASEDLDQIWLYIARHGSVERAEQQIEEFTSRFVILASNPEAGRRRDELKAGIRSHPAGDYVIYYRAAGNVVTILRVVHGARDIRSLWE